MDDFFFTALLEALVNGQVVQFLSIGDEIGFPVVPEKTVWGTLIIVFLVILIDTVHQTISIPIEKREKAIKLLTEVCDAGTVTVLKLQQLTDLLNLLVTAIVPGRMFTRRMYVKYGNWNMKQHYHINVGRELKADYLVSSGIPS